MEKPVNRSFSNAVKKQLLCCSLALLLCILAYAYQSMSGTGMGSSKAANVANATISGVVFNDVNGNGERDVHEEGISNVTVHLYHSDGKLAGTALTDTRGEYTFSVITDVDYQIKLDNVADYTTGPLKDYQLTAVHSDSCDSQSGANAVLPDSSKPVGPGNYPQIAVRDQAPGNSGHSFDIGFTSSKFVGDDNGVSPSSWHYCLPFGDEDAPPTGAQPVQTPIPTGATPTPGSKPGQVPPPVAKKPVLSQAPKKSASAVYPKLPATGSDPAGHPLP